VRVDHPGDWEIALASGPGKPGRFTLTDRHFHRLDIRWRNVRHPPNLKLMLEKHRQNPRGKLRELVPLSGLPADWVGLLRKGDGGCATHAVKVFSINSNSRNHRLVVEATLVWPDRRDTALEGAILDSVAPDFSAPRRLWQAMGLSLEVGREFHLRRNDSKVGRVRWEFAAEAGKSVSRLIVERLALPEYWLKGSLADWLVEQLPPKHGRVREETSVFNGHRALRLVSRGQADLWAFLRGLRPIRLDLAWLCPLEGRVYHVSVGRMSKDPDLDLPEGLVIRCCRPGLADLRRGDEENLSRRNVPKQKQLQKSPSAASLLQAIPYRNQALEITSRSDGSALVSVPIAKPKYLVPPLSWILPFSPRRWVELEPVGSGVLRMCDGQRTVEAIIEEFATDHRLSFREAQLSVAPFLRQLTQRGLVVIVGRNKDDDRPS
jgi:hypothetical protein